MSLTSSARVARALAVLIAAAGLAHLPVTREHLSEAPYVGVSFAVFAVMGVALGLYLWLRPSSRRGAEMAGVLCAAAVATYAATRLVAFPQIGDDVGNWFEPWGVVSVALESLAVVAAAVSLRGGVAASRRVPAVQVEGPAVRRRAAA